jgi:hypothetical protein
MVSKKEKSFETTKKSLQQLKRERRKGGGVPALALVRSTRIAIN